MKGGFVDYVSIKGRKRAQPFVLHALRTVSIENNIFSKIQ